MAQVQYHPSVLGVPYFVNHVPDVVISRGIERIQQLLFLFLSEVGKQRLSNTIRQQLGYGNSSWANAVLARHQPFHQLNGRMRGHTAIQHVSHTSVKCSAMQFGKVAALIVFEACSQAGELVALSLCTPV